jgi:hypothetical protein
MRLFLFTFLILAVGLPACDQDYAASNSDRETFLGDVRQVDPSPREAHADAASPAPAVSAGPVPSADR